MQSEERIKWQRCLPCLRTTSVLRPAMFLPLNSIGVSSTLTKNFFWRDPTVNSRSVLLKFLPFVIHCRRDPESVGLFQRHRHTYSSCGPPLPPPHQVPVPPFHSQPLYIMYLPTAPTASSTTSDKHDTMPPAPLSSDTQPRWDRYLYDIACREVGRYITLDDIDRRIYFRTSQSSEEVCPPQ